MTQSPLPDMPIFSEGFMYVAFPHGREFHYVKVGATTNLWIRRKGLAKTQGGDSLGLALGWTADLPSEDDAFTYQHAPDRYEGMAGKKDLYYPTRAIVDHLTAIILAKVDAAEYRGAPGWTWKKTLEALEEKHENYLLEYTRLPPPEFPYKYR
jgi:hypothetical protein